MMQLSNNNDDVVINQPICMVYFRMKILSEFLNLVNIIFLKIG
jgi:hypothetical protein